jgi:hypothetical protein
VLEDERGVLLLIQGLYRSMFPITRLRLTPL